MIRRVMDGPMGTALMAHGFDPAQEASCDWNRTRPEIVCGIHRGYVEAGATILLSNTFVASDREMLALGVTLARAECPVDGQVWLNLGPLRGLPRTLSEGRAFLDGLPPFDGILLETFSDIDALMIAGAFVSTGHPVALSLTYRQQAGRITTFDGEPPETFADAAEDEGLVALGVNCGRDMPYEDVVAVIERYRARTAIPLIAKPNQIGDPSALWTAGATWVGGCCGTDATWIRAVRDAMPNADSGAALS